MDMITCPKQNIILIDVFYQLLLFIGDRILLEGLKLGDDFLDLLVLGDIVFARRGRRLHFV